MNVYLQKRGSRSRMRSHKHSKSRLRHYSRLALGFIEYSSRVPWPVVCCTSYLVPEARLLVLGACISLANLSKRRKTAIVVRFKIAFNNSRISQVRACAKIYHDQPIITCTIPNRSGRTIRPASKICLDRGELVNQCLVFHARNCIVGELVDVGVCPETFECANPID